VRYQTWRRRARSGAPCFRDAGTERAALRVELDAAATSAGLRAGDAGDTAWRCHLECEDGRFQTIWESIVHGMRSLNKLTIALSSLWIGADPA
jgi:hypothetical protein